MPADAATGTNDATVMPVQLRQNAAESSEHLIPSQFEPRRVFGCGSIVDDVRGAA